MNDFAGLQRGIVAAVDDPQQRKRCRVRVIGVHRDEVPVEALPWAEWSGTAGKGFGDIPSLEVGDPVFLLFEKNDRRFPVIFGGWLSYQGGTNDMPNELLGDYAKNQQRWVRVDRAGNKITMSPLPEELFIELQSGEAKITLRGLDGTFEIQTEARTVVRSPQVQVIGAEVVSVETERLLATVSGEATIRSEDVVNISGATQVNIGKYQPPTSTVTPPPKLTAEVQVHATDLIRSESLQAMEFVAGTTIDVEATGNITVHSAANITITGDAKVEVLSDGPVNVTASEVNITSETAKVTISAQTDVEIETAGKVAITAATSVEVEATGNFVTVQAAANVDVTAGGDATVTCAGRAEINATGFIALNSASKIELTAPVIEIEAASLLSLTGASTARLDGGVVLIG